MPLWVNGEELGDRRIIEEMERMRAEYEKAFGEMDVEKREHQLLDWARENVVERTLIQQHAAADKQPIPPKEIARAYEELKSKYKDDAAFFKALGITEKDVPRIKSELEEQLRVRRLVDGLQNKAEPPSDADIAACYRDNESEFVEPEQVHAAHIVKHTDRGQDPVKAEKEIRQIKKAMNAGEPFEQIAGKNSDCPDSMGDLGWFPRGKMVAEFENVVFNMKPGEVSDIFRTPFGFHIAKVHEKRDARTRPLDTVQASIAEKLTQERKNAEVERFVDSLKADSEIRFEMSDMLEALLARRVFQGKEAGTHPKPLRNVLVKPSGPDCNMACGYCFYLKKQAIFAESKTHRMSDETLREMIKQVMVQGDQTVHFGWQGGEPTLMGLDFYRNAVEYQNRYGGGRKVGNGFQTNGLLLNREWTRFFKENDFLVGLSIDGPEHVHDHYRRLRDGGPTWKKIHKNARMLLDAGVNVNALTVVNNYSAGYPEEIYNFHKQTGFGFMQFIPCVEPDPDDSGKSAPFSVTPHQFGAFLCKIFDLWRADFDNGRPTTSVRLFDSLFHVYVGHPPPDCALMHECGVYVAVEHNGNVYPCDFFVEPRWKLGNIHEDRLIELLNSDKQNEFGRRKANLEKVCRKCEWLNYCRGGCPKDRFNDPRDKNVSHFCGAYKTFYNHAHGEFQELARQWNEARRPGPAPGSRPRRQRPAAAGPVGRNDPCPCGSGKKYKKCCGKK